MILVKNHYMKSTNINYIDNLAKDLHLLRDILKLKILYIKKNKFKIYNYRFIVIMIKKIFKYSLKIL